MKHFATEKWIDFLNEVASPGDSQSMEKHLRQGCKLCMKTVSMWRHVRQSAAAEKSYQPPANTVRVAKAAFVTANFKGQRKGAGSRVSVLFDSLLQPVFEGARSAVASSRQMLYRADPFQIDLQIEAGPGGRHLVVTGQLLDLSDPAIVGKDVSVLLSNMRGHAVHAVSNQHGEFSCEIKNSGDLQMTFNRPGGEPIVISLRDALGQMSEEKN